VDWFRHVNNYCERLDASYWAEPVNSLSNAGFVLAAIMCWRILGARRDIGARLLIVILFLIGIGSFLFHTHAQVWAAVADVAPIQGFILVYVYLATVRFFEAPCWAGILAALGFIPYALVVSKSVAAMVGSLNGSVGYVPVPILIAIYALLLMRRAPAASKGLAVGAAILSVSLVFRTVDPVVCSAFLLGTHFIWHILNASMLGWMILVLAKHADPTLAKLRAHS
jgi:hypothetical protein